METRVTTKGRIVIPSSIRRQLAIKEGTRIHVEVEETSGKIILTPITREFINRLRGKYRGVPLMAALMLEKRREKRQG